MIKFSKVAALQNPRSQRLCPRAIFIPCKPSDFCWAKRKIQGRKERGSTDYSNDGNLWFNLDQKFSDHIFSFYIKEDDLVHFGGDPQKLNGGKMVSVRGKIQVLNGMPTINIRMETEIALLER